MFERQLTACGDILADVIPKASLIANFS